MKGYIERSMTAFCKPKQYDFAWRLNSYWYSMKSFLKTKKMILKIGKRSIEPIEARKEGTLLNLKV